MATYEIAEPSYVDAKCAAVPRHLQFVSGASGTLSAPITSLGYSPPVACTLSSIKLVAGSVLPTGQSIVVDVLKNGVSIFTVSANRPALAPGASTSLTPASNANVTTFGTTDVITTQVVQVGSGTPGTGLTVVVDLTPLA